MNRIKSVNRVFLITVLLSIVGSVINTWIFEFTGNYFLILLMSQIILVIPSLIYLITQKVNVAQAIRFKKLKISNIILIIIFAYLITPLMNLINAISMLYVQNDTTDIMNNIVENNGFFLSLIMVAFVPCILEESVYRGIFFNEYSKVNVLKGVFLSGFLFGIIHGNLNQFSYAFAMGIVFALLIEATDSILATMIVHFFINGTSVVIMALYPKLFQFLETLYGSDKFNADELMKSMNSGILDDMTLGYIIQSYGITAVITTVLAFIVFKTLAKNSGRWEHVKSIFKRNNRGVVGYSQTDNYTVEGDISLQDSFYEIPQTKRKLITVSLITGIIICVTLMLVNEIFAPAVPEQNAENFYTVIRLFLF